MTNTQSLPAVLAFAGVKGAHAKISAVDSIKAATLHAITDGNSRPFDDTKTALNKGVTKDGEYANNLQGVVLAAVITAAVSARQYFETLHTDTKGGFSKKLDAQDKLLAFDYANSIAQAFDSACTFGLQGLTDARAISSAKTKATKEAKAATTNAAELKTLEAEKQAETVRLADTVTISEFLSAIKKGDKKALIMAHNITLALEAYTISQANTQHAKNARKDAPLSIAA